jgi:hypothetical protein
MTTAHAGPDRQTGNGRRAMRHDAQILLTADVEGRARICISHLVIIGFVVREIEQVSARLLRLRLSIPPAGWLMARLNISDVSHSVVGGGREGPVRGAAMGVAHLNLQIQPLLFFIPFFLHASLSSLPA